MDELGARTLIAVGMDREGDLTNALFWLRHPEAAFRKIRPDEPELAKEWVAIRNSIVRPVLERANTAARAGAPPAAKRSGRPAAVDEAGGTPGIIRADQPGDYKNDEEKSQFRRDVDASQLNRALKDPRKTFIPNLPESELETVEDNYRLHKSAAGDARGLRAAVRRTSA